MSRARSISPPRPWSRSLGARLATLAIGQLALIALLGLAIAQILRPPAPRDLGALAEAARARIEPALDGPAEALDAAVHAAAHEGGLELSLYAPDGSVRASSVDPPVHLGPPGRPPAPRRAFDEGPPPPFDEGPPGPRGLFDRWPPPPPIVLRVGDHRLAIRPARPAPVYLGMLLTLLGGALVLGIGGVLTARWIVRPLEALRRTARSITDGHLEARTELRRDDEIGELASAFDDMADRIGVLLKKERELLANVSHELRTPLARIRVALDLAVEGHDGGKAALEGVAVDLEELESIVESVLSAARMERAEPGAMDAGLPARSLRDVDAREIVEGAASRFRVAHPDRPLEVSAPDGLAPLLVEPLLVRRVLGNLLENAHTYSPDPKTPIELVARDDADHVVLEVRDRGIGIEESDLARVFEPFFRAEKSRTRRAGGVGLGLTLSKRIVEAHGGTLALESKAGEGTVARVRLPVRAS